jgi:hypothetical protein
VPAGLTTATAVAGGGAFSVALKSDGTVIAWGDNSANQTNVPGGLTGVTAIAAGGGHGLALKSDGTVRAWGYDLFSQATVPPGLSGVRAIAAGGFHSLALLSNSTVVVWGRNWEGQAIAPSGLTNVIAVAGGYLHSLALVGTPAPPSAPALGGPQAVAGGGTFSFSVPTVPGVTYVVEYSSVASGGTWIPVLVIFGDGSVMTFTDTNATGAQRFYRVRSQ